MRETHRDRVPRLTRWAIGVLAVLLAVGAVRLTLSARTGSEELATSLHRLSTATLGMVLDVRTPAESPPDEQLDFWLAEIDRILAVHPEDAELHAAAAVMLAQPSLLYTSELGREVANSASSNPQSTPSLLFERLRETRERFDLEGSRKAQELIRRATELDPEDPRWWRVRAILMWPPPLSSQEFQPLDPDWRQVLRLAERHDPDNALYSLLGSHWASTTAFVVDANGERVVGDRAAWQETIDYAADAARYRHVLLGEPALDGIVRLHALSAHPRATTLESIRARFVASRAAHTAALLVRSLIRMAGLKEISDSYEDRAELLSIAREIRDLARERSDDSLRFDNLLVQMDTILWQAEADLERERGAVSEATAAGLRNALARQAAFQRAAADFQPWPPSSAEATAAITGVIALSLFAALIAGVFLQVAIWLVASRSRESLRLAWWPFLLCIGGVGLSLLFLGTKPAGQTPGLPDPWLLGPPWISQTLAQWLTHDGPAWSVAFFLALACLVVLCRGKTTESLGRLLAVSMVLAMLSLNVWVWLEPVNVAVARRSQLRYEAYIRSMDEYYEPFEKSLDRAMREAGDSAGAAG